MRWCAIGRMHPQRAAERGGVFSYRWTGYLPSTRFGLQSRRPEVIHASKD
jgi:hypothetical protein